MALIFCLFSLASSRFISVRLSRSARKHLLTSSLRLLHIPIAFHKKPRAWHSSRAVIISSHPGRLLGREDRKLDTATCLGCLSYANADALLLQLGCFQTCNSGKIYTGDCKVPSWRVSKFRSQVLPGCHEVETHHVRTAITRLVRHKLKISRSGSGSKQHERKCRNKRYQRRSNRVYMLSIKIPSLILTGCRRPASTIFKFQRDSSGYRAEDWRCRAGI